MLSVSPAVKAEESLELDASGLPYKELNHLIRRAVERGTRRLKLTGINGHRYLATGLELPVEIDIYGVPGQDLAAFMQGPSLRVHNNAQDGVGNTMDCGKVVVCGMAGDVIGYGMRGGKIHILGDVGYRVGIHMKAYLDKVPVIVIGGRAGDFLGEYMAGGAIVVLGLQQDGGRPLVGNFLGTGMHGGVIYLRGEVEPWRLGHGLSLCPTGAEDHLFLAQAVGEFAADFGLDPAAIMTEPFYKVAPTSCRPYGNMYAY